MPVIEERGLYGRETEASLRRIAGDKMKKLGFGALILGEIDERDSGENGWHESGRRLAAELRALTPKLEVLTIPVSDTLAMQAACEVGAVAMVPVTTAPNELRSVHGTRLAGPLTLPDEAAKTVILVAPLERVQKERLMGLSAR